MLGKLPDMFLKITNKTVHLQAESKRKKPVERYGNEKKLCKCASVTKK